MQIVFRERFDSLYQTETFKTLWCLIVASKKMRMEPTFQMGCPLEFHSTQIAGSSILSKLYMYLVITSITGFKHG